MFVQVQLAPHSLVNFRPILNCLQLEESLESTDIPVMADVRIDGVKRKSY
jgi:hypothetical protein